MLKTPFPHQACPQRRVLVSMFLTERAEFGQKAQSDAQRKAEDTGHGFQRSLLTQHRQEPIGSG